MSSNVGHSFRIGAATTATKKGIQDSLIRTLDHWESMAYQLYVTTPHEQLITLAANSEVLWNPRAYVVSQ